MGYFESDALEMLEVYLLETRQLNNQLADILLEAERKGRFEEDSIHSIFRVMHTIKSSSAMMGLGGLSSMAHKLEDLFSFYREHPENLESPEPGLFDLLFEASDFVEQELEQMKREGYKPGDTSGIENRAQACLAGMKQGKVQGKVLETAQAQGLNKAGTGQPRGLNKSGVGLEPDQEQGLEPDGTLRAGPKEGETAAEIPEAFVAQGGTVVNVTLEEGCRMENIRAFMLVRSITGICTLVETYPKDLDKAGESAEYIGKNGVFIRFESGDKEAVLKTLRNGLFVAWCKVVADSEPEDSLHGGSGSGLGPASGNRKAGGEKDRPEMVSDDFMEVRIERLDQLQNQAAQLLLQMQILENELSKSGLEDVENGTGHQISLLVSQIERSVMEMRLVPVAKVVPKLKRALRDMCRDQKKEAELVVQCADVEADKSVVDYVSEALLHMVRNAMDHGIEAPDQRQEAGKDRRGKVVFSAENAGGELRLTISDDGRGIDMEKVREKAMERSLMTGPGEDIQQIKEVLLSPGFSTNETVTEYSGRGVGLDVVKNIMEEVGGSLSIRSKEGEGSSFAITVPLNLASMECVRFKIGPYRFSIPARHVYRFLEYGAVKDMMRCMNGREYLLYEDRMVPIIDLHGFYSLGGEIPERAVLVYVRGAEHEGFFLMDHIYGQKRIVIKSLPALLGSGFRSRTGICGCSIMGSGHICAALDTEILIGRYKKEERYDR